MWDTNKDTLEYDLMRMPKGKDRKTTKRNIVSILATLFDPQGIISPVSVKDKVLFQDLCAKKLGWEKPLPEDKISIWKKMVTWFGKGGNNIYT